MTPLPNQQLWTGPTTGYLASQDFFANGGWWHDHHILEATGDGIEKEEPRAWAGWWNELIVYGPKYADWMIADARRSISFN